MLETIFVLVAGNLCDNVTVSPVLLDTDATLPFILALFAFKPVKVKPLFAVSVTVAVYSLLAWNGLSFFVLFQNKNI